jgi:hypothetical protein
LTTAPVFDGFGSIVIGPTALLRYNFVQPDWRLVPYLPAGGGFPYNDSYRDKTQRASGQGEEFYLQTTAGLHFLLTVHCALDVEGGYIHISNAGTNPRNGGINALGGSSVAARVADIILDGVVTGQGPAAHQAGRHQLPWGMADHRERLIRSLHLSQELLHFQHHPHGVSVEGAAGELNRIKLVRSYLIDLVIHSDLHGLGVVANSLNFAEPGRDDDDFCPRLLQRTHGLDQFRFFKPIGGKTGNMKTG